jgi:hypothetical protein
VRPATISTARVQRHLARGAGDRHAGAEHLRDDVLRDLAGGEPGVLEDLLAAGVVDVLVGQAQLVDGRVDARLAQHLTHARADAADADAVLERDDEAVPAASSTTDGCTGIAQRGSITVAPIPCALSRSATSRARVANGPIPTSSTSSSSPRESTSTPSCRRSSAGISGVTAPFGKRITVGASSTATPPPAPRAGARRRGRGDADPRHDLQHRQVPQTVVARAIGPVTPARSSTNVTRHGAARRPSAPGRTRGS